MDTPDSQELVCLASYSMLTHIRCSSDFTEGAYFSWEMGWALDMHCHLIFTAAIISILQREEETEEAH